MADLGTLQNEPAYDPAPLPVGCDDGFAAIKLAFYRDGALVQRAIPARAAVGGNLSIALSGHSTDAYIADEVAYTVSPHLNRAEDTRFNSYPVSALNRVLVHHALRDAGLGGARLKLATGLPPGVYYRGAGLNTNMITAKLRNVISPIRAGDGALLANIVEHRVYSESTAAVVDYCLDNDGTVAKEVTAPIAVVDIGGRTTDVVTVLPPGNRIDFSRSGSDDVGVLDIADHLRQNLVAALQVDAISLAALESALFTGSIKLFGSDHDVTKYVEAAAREVGERILRKVERHLGQGAELDMLLFVGGGAELMQGILKKYAHAHVPPAPSYANARGFLKYMLYVEGQAGAPE